MQAIEDNKAAYQEAAKEYDLPWQILAVLHKMEHGLKRSNPKNGQGVYQLYSYTDGGKNENRFEPAGSVSEEEFKRQTKIAAKVVSEKAGGMDLSKPDNVKKLFFLYNGAAQEYKDKAIAMGFSKAEAENGEGSAYVMNRYDARRDPTSDKMDPLWPGRFTKDKEYNAESTSNNFGAYVQYEALGGAADGCSSGGLVSGGMTFEEAQKFMQEYINLAKKYRNDRNVTIDGLTHSNKCYEGALANCVSFSKWFLNKYTDWKPHPTGDGREVVGTLINDGFEDGGHTPRLYAVFSRSTGEWGHTGIVLGINEENDEIIIGEANCGSTYGGIKNIGAKKRSLKEFSGNNYTYAYTDNKITGLGN